MTISKTPSETWLDEAVRRQAVYLHLQELVVGRDVVEVWREVPQPRGAQVLVSRGARRVTVVAPQSRPVGRADAKADPKIGHSAGDMARSGLPGACADVVIALDAHASDIENIVSEAKRILRPDGVLVLGVASKDRPQGASADGASYYDIVDACGSFERVRMVGMAPFAGAALVEYGVKDPEPILDGTLVERGERVDHYIAIAGPDRRGDFGYGVVQVPVSSVRHGAVAPASAPSVISSADGVVAELRNAIELHAAEMLAKEEELAERDAYIAELEREGRGVDELVGRVAAAEARRDEAERLHRDARRIIAEQDGRLGNAVAPSAPAKASVVLAGSDLEALKTKLADVEADNWKQVRARGEAEAAAAEVRADSVRKLQDARKIAQLELMRAMEEASKKLVSARDDLARSETQRKALKAEVASLREGAPATTPAPAAGADNAARDAETRLTAMQDRLVGVERTLTEAQRDRAELEQARAALKEAQNQLAALERDRPARSEVDGMRDELTKLRARNAEVYLELQRRDGAVERTAAAAAHERARAERLVADERQALAERNDARARAAQSQAKLSGVESERERAEASFRITEARAHKAENEVKEKRERIRQLKRELEEAERRVELGIRRARTLETVRSRVQALESAVANEVTRISALESSIRVVAG